jgi:hypothetical protein
MPRGRRTSSRSEIFSHDVKISSFAARVGIRVDRPRGQPPEIDAGPWLELRGALEEPIKGVHDVLVSLYPEDDPHIGLARPASIGSVIGLKPRVDVVIPWSHRDFDRLWALALSGQLGFAHLAVTKPYYGRALVVSASFSNEREE